MILTLPSGNHAPLRPLGLEDLLEAGGRPANFALRAWAHPDIELDAENLAEWLDEGDCWAIGRWCLEHLADEDIDKLAAITATYRVEPSRYLRLRDRAAGLKLDMRVAERIAEHRRGNDGEVHGAASPTADFARMEDPA